MKYGDLQRAIAARTGTSVKTVRAVLNEFFDTVEATALAGDKVTVPRFGRFWGRKVKATPHRRIGNRVVQIPAQTKLAFTPSSKAVVKE